MPEVRVRRTVSLDPTVAEAVDEAVADGAARSVSAFFEDAARGYLRQLAGERLRAQAGLLDAEEEHALSRAAAGSGDTSPRRSWPTLGGDLR